jgi:hypothetical protein
LPISPSEAVPGLLAQRTAGLRAAKNVTFSLFKSFFTQVFTLWPRTPLKKNAMFGATPKKRRPRNYQNGQGHFFGFQPPKKRVGSPALVNTTRQFLCRVHRRPYGRVVTRT